MTLQEFNAQWTRLKVKFGRHMDDELKILVSQTVSGMSELAFKRACDVWIGERTINKPPMLSDFREADRLEQKRKFDNDLRGATDMLKRGAPEEMRRHLRAVLSSEYGGVESATDALEIARLKARTK